jgi:hypothetical protein
LFSTAFKNGSRRATTYHEVTPTALEEVLTASEKVLTALEEARTEEK